MNQLNKREERTPKVIEVEATPAIYKKHLTFFGVVVIRALISKNTHFSFGLDSARSSKSKEEKERRNTSNDKTLQIVYN